MFALRCVPRLKGLSGNTPGGRRASCMPQFCDSSVACSTTCCSSTLATLRLLRLSQHCHHALNCQVPSRPMVSATTCRHPAHQFLCCAPRRTSRCSRRSAVPAPSPCRRRGQHLREHAEASADGAEVRRSCSDTALNDEIVEVPGMV